MVCMSFFQWVIKLIIRWSLTTLCLDGINQIKIVVMKIIRKVLKWIGLSVGALLMLIILAGLVFRIFSPEPTPPGKLVDIGGFKLHINSTGEKSNQPTVVIETGQALPSEHYHWLSEGLKDSLRVVRYDRAGIAYSDLSHTPRDPTTIARELHALLEASGESPPYILVGHSFGGLFIRVFTQLYPDEVKAMVFIDSSHPDQRERLHFPEQKDVSWMLSTAAFLADMGILGLFDRLNGSILYAEDLPDEVNNRFYDYTLDGKYYRGYREEIKWEDSVYDQSRETTNFGSLPIRVFTANKKYNGAEAKPEWVKLQREMADLSTDNKHLLVDGHHNSIYTTKENANIICREIIQLLRVL
jgi:pimeloyl-ACP methyl ester carboxylesterase